ncbi:SGNH/GDSL hydrolase family protein [Streptomyces sp. DSM 44917]|uniref:SGNH/GDSL hydrolase family protein n=1 Tax=Streptomyces boetiae TaxID=3075541 RepID=A0ABU2LFY6_9ACTN|nr:SGNH/GDSL hydrolase family protein [Streptomyces sp. DSM 44917]MDT0310153.1 SGNH/GDSL hydrolase family protein [Streptomyces sp. DSM 44917]
MVTHAPPPGPPARGPLTGPPAPAAARESPPPGPAPAAAGLLRFAALGDSLTEGLGDPRPEGGWRGWVPLLAASLPQPGAPVRVANLARSGARTADAAGPQLAAALALRPHLAAVIVGGNDTLRSPFDIGRAARDLDAVLRALTARGTVVLTACLPDPGGSLRLPRSLTGPLARRMHALNDVVHHLSRRYAAVHAHLAHHPLTQDPAAWSVDRLHPSELGHRLLAREFHARLAERGLALGPPPPAAPDHPPPTRSAGAWWLATRGTRWVLARSTDLLPGLLRLAVAEGRHRRAGTQEALDHAAREATRAALRALPAPNGAPAPAPGVPSAATRPRSAVPGARNARPHPRGQTAHGGQAGRYPAGLAGD